jgi:hypothetical protein
MKLYPDDAMGGSDDPPDPPGPEPPLSILLQCDKGVHYDKYPNVLLPRKKISTLPPVHVPGIWCIVWVLTNVMQGLFKNNLSRKTIEQFSHGKLSPCKYLNWFMFKQINFGAGLKCSQWSTSGP